jgi:hypothetical protein
MHVVKVFNSAHSPLVAVNLHRLTLRILLTVVKTPYSFKFNVKIDGKTVITLR